jgi:periplasmic protein TonB
MNKIKDMIAPRFFKISRNLNRSYTPKPPDMKSLSLLSLLLIISLCINAQTKETKEIVTNPTDTALTVVEVESEFPGGLPAWQSFLTDRLYYPNKAVRKKVEGTVVLQFIVCTDGTVCNVEAVSGPELLREAAIKAFKATPNWIPAMQSGKKVKSYKKQPITFRLQ